MIYHQDASIGYRVISMAYSFCSLRSGGKGVVSIVVGEVTLA